MCIRDSRISAEEPPPINRPITIAVDIHIETDAVFVASFMLDLHRSDDVEGEYPEPYRVSPVQLNNLLLTDHALRQRDKVLCAVIPYLVKPFSDEHLIDLNYPTKRLQVSAMIIVWMRDEHGIDLRDIVACERGVEHLSFIARIYQQRLSPAHEGKAIPLPHVEHHDTVTPNTNIQE